MADVLAIISIVLTIVFGVFSIILGVKTNNIQKGITEYENKIKLTEAARKIIYEQFPETILEITEEKKILPKHISLLKHKIKLLKEKMAFLEICDEVMFSKIKDILIEIDEYGVLILSNTNVEENKKKLKGATKKLINTFEEYYKLK